MLSGSLFFLAWVILVFGFNTWLNQRQLGYVTRHRDTVPDAFANMISLQQHQHASDYTCTKTRFSSWHTLWNMLILLGWTILGGFDWLNTYLKVNGWSEVTNGTFVLSCLFLANTMLNIPFSIYRTFVIEQKYGFNNTQAKTFAGDLLRQLLLFLLIGLPLLYTIVWLLYSLGPNWWIAAWITWLSFNIFILWAYPTLLAPLFNKFTPLGQADLQQRITDLLERCGYKSDGVFVMDGSRRSRHGNAYFSGFGANKRIVFFDTLLETLTTDEVEAVLAHELGHFRRHHIQKQFLITAVSSLMLLWLCDALIYTPEFYTALGVNSFEAYLGLGLFLLVVPVFLEVFQPFVSQLSRKFEFEADQFAAGQTQSHFLINALVKLYRDNAAPLCTDPLYSAFHDSHPPAPIRIAHLQKCE